MAKKKVKKIDLQKMTQEQADELAKKLSADVNAIAEEAVVKANKVLNKYGLTTKMQLVIETKE